MCTNKIHFSNNRQKYTQQTNPGIEKKRCYSNLKKINTICQQTICFPLQILLFFNRNHNATLKNKLNEIKTKLLQEKGAKLFNMVFRLHQIFDVF